MSTVGRHQILTSAASSGAPQQPASAARPAEASQRLALRAPRLPPTKCASVQVCKCKCKCKWAGSDPGPALRTFVIHTYTHTYIGMHSNRLHSGEVSMYSSHVLYSTDARHLTGRTVSRPPQSIHLSWRPWLLSGLARCCWGGGRGVQRAACSERRLDAPQRLAMMIARPGSRSLSRMLQRPPATLPRLDQGADPTRNSRPGAPHRRPWQGRTPDSGRSSLAG